VPLGTTMGICHASRMQTSTTKLSTCARSLGSACSVDRQRWTPNGTGSKTIARSCRVFGRATNLISIIVKSFAPASLKTFLTGSTRHVPTLLHRRPSVPSARHASFKSSPKIWRSWCRRTRTLQKNCSALRNNKCFYRVPGDNMSSRTWTEALDECRLWNAGATLPKVTDNVAERIVSTHCQAIPTWIGLKRNLKSSLFSWPDGSLDLGHKGLAMIDTTNNGDCVLAVNQTWVRFRDTNLNLIREP
jgi:hypothetical protein